MSKKLVLIVLAPGIIIFAIAFFMAIWAFGQISYSIVDFANNGEQRSATIVAYTGQRKEGRTRRWRYWSNSYLVVSEEGLRVQINAPNKLKVGSKVNLLVMADETPSRAIVAQSKDYFSVASSLLGGSNRAIGVSVIILGLIIFIPYQFYKGYRKYQETDFES